MMNKLKEYSNIILYALLIISLGFQVKILEGLCSVYNIESIKFFQQFTTALYAFVALNGCFFGLFFLILKKKKVVLPLFLATIVSNIVFYLAWIDKMQPISNVAGDFLMSNVLRFRFIKLAVHDEALVWTIPLAFYVGVLFIIIGNFFIKDKGDFKSKYEKKIIYMGIGLYLALFPFAFFITHFSSVGSYYQYGVNSLIYTQKAIEVYEKKEKRDYFQVQDVKWFKTLDETINYYKSPQFVSKLEMEHNKGKKEFYGKVIVKLDDLKKYGWQTNPSLKYEEMESFDEWVQVAYNFKFEGISLENKSMWYEHIIPLPKENKETHQDSARNGTFFIHQAKDGSFYSRFILDRSFKDNRMNVIFNLIFVAYHVLFIGFFLYLIGIHNKRFTKGENKNV